jgi:ribonuclease PH
MVWRMSRPDGRRPDQLRPTRITPHYLKDPEGSALVQAGDTWVVCTASVEERLPQWLREQGTGGWVTAEYAMLPRATTSRTQRGGGGRAREIERLIGRALRASIDLAALGPRMITVDCDVIQADGGTRTAAITGGWVALELACRKLVKAGVLARSPVREPVAAVSVGLVGGEPRLDLAYLEDSKADVDMNVVMTAAERFVELQGTGEHTTFDRAQLDALCALATGGVRSLVTLQRQAVEQPRAA